MPNELRRRSLQPFFKAGKSSFFALILCIFLSVQNSFSTVTVSGANGVSGSMTLSAAITALNATSQSGKNVTIAITASETGLTSLTALTGTAGMWTSLAIYPTTSGITISGSIAGALLSLNGADNVTIDGRPNRTGTAIGLTINNTNTGTSASTITFNTSAQNNTVQYCLLQGGGTATATGIVTFSSSGTNSGDVIDHCNVTNNGTRKKYAIYAVSASGSGNQNITISNNNFYDLWMPSATSNTIYIGSYCTLFTITGNSFYETSNIATTATSTYAMVYVTNSTNGTGYTITNNYMGGAAAGCSGTMSIGSGVSQSITVNAIYISQLASGTSSIQGNQISNITINTTSATPFRGLSLSAGNYNIGNLTGNKFGLSTVANNILVTSGYTTSTYSSSAALYITSAGTVNVSNNTIAGINAAHTGNYPHHLYGIYHSGASALTVSNNLIGSETVANSLVTSSTSTTIAQSLFGIWSSGTGTISLTGNTLANLNNACTSATTTVASRTAGIYLTAGTETISNNKIHDLFCACANTTGTTTTSVTGILATSTTAAKSITGNTLYNLKSTYASFAGVLYGMYLTNSTSGNVISNNYLYGLAADGASSVGAGFYGIRVSAGGSTFANNVINLSSSKSTTLCGIYETGAASTTNNFYFNTILLSGTQPSTSTYKTYCLYSAVTTNIRVFQNNVFVNTCSTPTGTNRHFTLYVATTGGTLTCNYNDYYATGTGNILGYYGANKTALPIVTSQDANSKNLDPDFGNASGTNANDLQTGISLGGVTVSGYTTDFEGTTRTAPSMGAFEFAPVAAYSNSIFKRSYANLGAAFLKINDGTLTGVLELRIKAATTETSAASLNASGSGSASFSSVSIYPTKTGLSITGNLNAPLIQLNGADNVTLDGRVNATGTTVDLLLSNTNAGTAANDLQLTESACSNTIRYCKFTGAGSGSTGGILFFATASTGNGNDNNNINNCKLTGLSASSRPYAGICSIGSSGKENSENTIDGCTFYDLLNPGASSDCISIGTGSSTFVIQNNQFYETTSFAPSTTAEFAAIRINNTSGNGFSILQNQIGGNATGLTGTWTKTNASTNVFYGIYISAGSSQASTIQGNTIRNFAWTNANNADWNGIAVQNGDVLIGTATANTIGSATGTGSVTVTNGAAGSAVYGIRITSSGAVTCSNNYIGSITATNSNAAQNTDLYGIYKSGVAGTTVINGNIAGSTTTSASLNASSTSTGASQVVMGIVSYGTGSNTISNNTVCNVLNSSTNYSSSQPFNTAGIATFSGANTLTDNSVSNMSCQLYVLVGILQQSTVASNIQQIKRNTIFNLSNTNASSVTGVYGIYFDGPTDVTNILSENFIHDLGISSTNISSSMDGIDLISGKITCFNNIISLGAASSGLYSFYGIWDEGSTAQISKVYHNTVQISGTASGTASDAFAYFKNNANGTSDVKNNILVNTRTGGSTGKYYAAGLPSISGTTIDANDYFTGASAAVLGRFNGTDVASLNEWRTQTSQDQMSTNEDPLFPNPASASAVDFQPRKNLPGLTDLAVYNDYSGTVRSTILPASGAWEWVNTWKGTASTSWGNTANWSKGIIPAAGESVCFDEVPVNHCYLDQDRTILNLYNMQSTYRLVLNGYQLTLAGGITFYNNAKIDGTNTSSTLRFSGNQKQTLTESTLYNQSIQNVSINNSSNVALNGSVRLLGILTCTTGKLDATTNGCRLIMGGSSEQTLSDNLILNNTLLNLTADNSAGVNLDANYTITGDITIPSGRILRVNAGKTLNASGTISNDAGKTGLVLRSASDGTASLIHAVNAVQGSVQRYIGGTASAWHFLSSPVDGQTIFGTEWTPSGTNGDGTGYDLYLWYEPTSCWIYNLNSDVSPSWTDTQISSCFTPGRGYLYATNSTNPINTFGGALNNGTITRPLTYTTASSFPGFNLLGNPYPSSIDWKTETGFSRSTLKADAGGYNFWTWSPTANNYGVYNSADADDAGTNNITRYIAPMQAFFVETTSDGSFSFKNDARVHTEANSWLRSSQSTFQGIKIKIRSENGAGSDEVRIRLYNEPTRTGTKKLFSPVKSAPSLFIPNGKEKYSILNYTDYSERLSVPVQFIPGVDDIYRLNFTTTANLNLPLYLEDLQTSRIYDLQKTDSLVIHAQKGDDANRFVMHFGDPDSKTLLRTAQAFVENDVLKITEITGNSPITFRLYDTMGRLKDTGKIASGETFEEPLTTRGVYLIELLNQDNKRTLRVVY